MEHHNETIRNVADFAAAFSAILAFLQLITPIFGLIGAIWTLMRIIEMLYRKPFSEIIRRSKSDAEQ